MSDDELVEQIQLGDRNAAEELIRRYYPSILRYCQWHCSSREQAEDLTQETFLKLFRSLPQYDGRRKFRAYLYTIANRLCIDESRRRKVCSLEDQGELASERNEILEIEDREEVRQLLGLLSPEQKEAVILLVVCIVSEVVKEPRYIPTFMPLFGLALMPVLFRSQFYGMGELEAVTRASGAQIILAKLVLAGAADMACITALLCLQVRLQDSRENMGQMVLYCLVPYLVCLTAMLRLLRLRRRESIPVCGIAVLGSGLGWGMSAVLLPGLYEASAAGIWLLAFLLFAGFFSKEIYYIIETRREGKIYGIIG